MSKRFTYSRSFHSIEGNETFTAVEFDAFDEAVKIVDRGIKDRKDELAKKYPGNTIGGSMTPGRAAPVIPPPEGGPMKAPFIPSSSAGKDALNPPPHAQ